VDGVAVGRGYALVDNGIETRERSAGVAGHAAAMEATDFIVAVVRVVYVGV
jgi:hypothetical protein